MKTMVRWLGRAAVAAVVLAVVAFVVVQGLRLAAKDDAHDAAIATMSASATLPAGDNGYADFMLAPYDVAAADVPAELAAELEAFARWQATDTAGRDLWASTEGLEPIQGYMPFAALQDRQRPLLENDDALCPTREPGCLARVAADPDATRAVLAVHADRLAAVQRSLRATRFDSPWPDDFTTPSPDFRQWRLALTDIALQAADGDRAGAAARGCTLLADLRRIDRQSRGIVQKLVAQAQAEGAAWLLLDLRQGGTPLPADCTGARVAPDLDEALVCEALRGEYRAFAAMSERMRDSAAGWQPRAWFSRAYLFDADLQDGWTARTMAGYCGDAAETLAAQGEVPDVPVTGISRDDTLCYAAFVNCVLAEIGTGSYASYARGSLDHAARLRVLLAALDIADGMPVDDAVRAAGNMTYPVTHDAASGELRVTTLNRETQVFAVPVRVVPAAMEAGVDAQESSAEAPAS